MNIIILLVNMNKLSMLSWLRAVPRTLFWTIETVFFFFRTNQRKDEEIAQLPSSFFSLPAGVQ